MLNKGFPEQQRESRRVELIYLMKKYRDNKLIFVKTVFYSFEQQHSIVVRNIQQKSVLSLKDFRMQT